MTGGWERPPLPDGGEPERDVLAPIRAVEDVAEGERVAAVGDAVRTMAANGMDALTEVTVKDYVVRNDLLKASAFTAIVKEARGTPLKPAHTRTPDSDQQEKVCGPDEVCAHTPALAATPDLLARAVETVHDLGVTGETRIIRGTYLTAVSQILPEPVSEVVKGTSAGGKSYATRSTLRLVPAEEFYNLTAGSQRALIYTDKDFAHKTIVLFEATALREVAETRDGDMTAMLVRTLISEGQIRYEVTEKDDQGRMTTREVIKDGPTNLIVTTTADNLHHENETRLLSLNVDESEQQTRAVMRKIAARRNQAVPAELPDLTAWHHLFHWLKHHGAHDVYIPYADYLSDAVSAAVVRMRRDFSTLLGMIEAHAILHQATRERDSYDRIVATATDYQAAREILADALAVSSGQKVKESVRRAVAAVDALGGAESDVLVAQVARHLKRDRTRVTRGLKDAADLGYLTNREDKAGRAARYRLGPDPLPEDRPALPPELPDDEGCARTPAQVGLASPQVSGGCAGVRVCAEGAGECAEDVAFDAEDEWADRYADEFWAQHDNGTEGRPADADAVALELVRDRLGGEVVTMHHWPPGSMGEAANP